MAELGSYYITIMPSMQGFTSEVKKQLGDLGNSGGKSFSNSFGDVLKGSAIGTALGNLASKAGQSIMDGLSTGIGRLDTIQNFPKVMESLGYSSEEAGKSIKTIMDHLDGLPTATQDMVTLTQAISDSTGDLDLATRAALGFNDMMLANGASSAEMATAQGVLNRVLGKGSATAAQWQSLCSVMPAQLGMVARSMLGTGASTEDLHAALEEGTVSWNDFLRAIADLDRSGYIDEAGNQIASFEEQARANSHGIGTAIDNVKNRIGAGWAAILEAIGREDIAGAIDKVSYGIKSSMVGVADTIGSLKQHLADLGAFEKLQTVMSMLGEKFQGFANAVSGAVDRIIPVIASLVDKGLQWIIDHGDSISRFIDTIAGAFGKVADTVGTALSAAMPVLGNLVDKVLTWILDHGEVVVALLGAMAAKMAFKGVVSGVTVIADLVTNFKLLGDVLPMIGKISDIPAAFQLLTEAGGPLSGVFSKLLGASTSLTGAVEGVGGALSGVALGPIAAIVAAIAVAVGAFKTLWDTNEGFRNAIMDIWNRVSEKFKEAGEKITQALRPIGEIFGLTFNDIGDVINALIDGLGKLWGLLCNVLAPAFVAVFSQIGSVISGIVDIVTGVFQVIGGIIEGFKTGDWTMFTDGLKSIWNGLWSIVTAPVRAVFDAINYILGQFGTSWDEVVGGVEATWNGFTGAVGQGIQAVKDTIGGAWDFITSTVGQGIQTVKDVVGGAWDFITNAVQVGVDFVAGILKLAADIITLPFQFIWENCKGIVTDAWNGIKDTVSNVVGNIASDLGAKWEGIKTTVTTVVGNIASDVSSKWEGIKSQVSTIVSNIASDVSAKWEDIKGRVSTTASNIATDLSSKWNDIKSKVTTTVSNIASDVSAKWEDIKGRVSTVAGDIGRTISEKFTAAKDDATRLFGDLASNVGDKLGQARDWAMEKAQDIAEFLGFPGLTDNVSSVFDTIKSLIEDPIGNAKRFIEGVIHDIENMFSWIHISFPDIKLPHFDWHWESIGDVVSLPVFDGISWYGKGGVFDTATLIGIGEKGKEAALPLNSTTYGEIARGIQGEMGGSEVADEIRALRLDVQALQLVVQLDSGVIAGGVYPHIDRRMEVQRRREALR